MACTAGYVKEWRHMSRTAEITRNTKETNITVKLDLDGSGGARLDSGIGFFDHMLDGFARHGFFDLEVKAQGGFAGGLPSYHRGYGHCPGYGY